MAAAGRVASWRPFQFNGKVAAAPSPVPRPLLTSGAVEFPGAPMEPAAFAAGSSKGCREYWAEVKYQIYNVSNPVAGGGSFAVDTDSIRPGYYWWVLYAAVHMGTASQIPVSFALCPDNAQARATIPAQSSAGPQPVGIVLTGTLGALRNDITAFEAYNYNPVQCPVYPLIIPNGFFLRAFNCATNNLPAFGTKMELRMAYLELEVSDPGPSF